MIDWAIDGMMEAQDSGVLNRLQDAKTEFHYQLLKVRAQELLQPAGHRDPRRVQDGGKHGMDTPSCGRVPKQQEKAADNPEEQPGGDRHIQGLHGRLHADQVHP
ncbi:MAG: hypothetical protein ACKPKO_05715, partial [Candidatus Fonsibacter sp.]